MTKDAYQGEPRVAQEFITGTLDGVNISPTSFEPAITRDLIGLREVSTYGPGHTYEHIYLNAERYCWQCLVGVQRGQGDVDMASYYKFDDESIHLHLPGIHYPSGFRLFLQLRRPAIDRESFSA